MKKITLLLAMVFIAGNLFSQTINQTTTWPDSNWTLTGTYTSGNLLLNPTTTDTQFQFDDAQVSNVGDVINVESPVVDLRAAFTAGEKVLKIGLTMAFTLTAATSETMGIQYWDADSSTWKLIPDGSPQSGDTAGDYTTCATGPQDVYFDFKNLTTNQQQNFKYRFFYNDGGLATGKGICMAAPTITSVNISCSAPTALHTTDVFINGANIGWTANSSEVQWGVEYGGDGFTLGSGTSDTTDQNPHGINGLAENTSYDFYVRANCTPTESGGSVYSPWSTKLNFTTLVSCPDPSSGTAGDITDTTASLSWTAGSGESTWNVEYGLQGYSQGSGGVISSFASTDNTKTGISGLTPSTSYDFYVQADCGGGNTSNWVGPFNFSTINLSIGWANIQWPADGTTDVNTAFTVYARVWADGVTNGAGAGAGIKAWIGYHTANTNPNTWTNWVQTTYNTDNGNNDEYMADIGTGIGTQGTYYYASRFQLNGGSYSYGGYSVGGGDFWDGSSFISGVLTVTNTLGIENQKIEGFSFYPNPVQDKLVLTARQNIDQIEIYNLLGQVIMITQPNQTNYELQLGSLKSGIYFLKVTVADKTGTYKIVKQ